jgi:flagellar protein FlaG
MPTVDISNDVMTAVSAVKASSVPVGPGMSEDLKSARETESSSTRKVPDVKEMAEALADVQKYADKVSGRALQFSIDEVLQRSVITVLEAGTDKVVRQIPSEEFVAVAKFLRSQTADTEFNDAIKGLLFDDES